MRKLPQKKVLKCEKTRNANNVHDMICHICLFHKTAQLAKKGSVTVSKGKRMLLFLIQW